MTKQSAARQQVLDLIERLGVGTAIPSERQLSADLGVSRLTVRAALDDLAREGYLVRRRGSGTYVQQPKISQELTMTSFSEDMRRRGMAPEQHDALARRASSQGRGSAVSSMSLHRRRDRRGQAASARRRRLDGDRDAPHSGRRRARASSRGISRARSTSSCATRYGVEIATATQTIEPTVTNEEESAALERTAPFARLPLRAHEPRRERPDTRVRPLDLSRRSLPDRLRADALVTAPTPDLDKSGLVCEIPRVADWYRPLDAPQDVVRPPATGFSDAPLARRRLEGDLA